MKKSIFILAALALLSASCTKTEVVNSGAQSAQKGIGFPAYTAKPTKAGEVTTANLGSFNVTAIGNSAVYFTDVLFSKNESSIWVSNPLYFWPRYELDFYAYNKPAYGTFTPVINSTDAKTLTYKPSKTLSEQEDLVVAVATGQSEPSGATNLTFEHYLTQVVVKAQNSNANYKIAVDGAKIAHLKNEGVYTFSDSKMTVTSGAADESYSTTFAAKTLSSDPCEVMSDAGTDKWFLVPQTVTAWNQAEQKDNSSKGTYLALKVKITKASDGYKVYPATGDESAWMAVPVPTELAFAQGKKYNVTFNFFGKNGAGYVDPEAPGDLDGDNTANDDKGLSIIGGAITFSATVSGWDTVDVLIDL